MKAIALKTALFIAFLPTFFPILSFSQVVNIERLRLKADTTGLFGNAEVALNLIENKKKILKTGGNLHLMFKKTKNVYLVISNINLIRAGDEDFVNNGFQHFRYNHLLTGRFIIEAFTQAQFNELLKVKNRDLAGAGLRLKIVRSKKFNFYSGFLYMYEYEEIKGENIIHRDHRMSDYLAIGLYLNDNFGFESTTYYQPLLRNFNDYRVSSENTFNFMITKNLSFNLSFSILFDTRQPEEIPGTTYELTNSLSYIF